MGERSYAEGECATKVFEILGEGGKCTTACLRSLAMEEGFRFRIGRGVRGEDELEDESITENDGGGGGRGRMRGGGLAGRGEEEGEGCGL